jgi:hypothetical protein
VTFGYKLDLKYKASFNHSSIFLLKTSLFKIGDISPEREVKTQNLKMK